MTAALIVGSAIVMTTEGSHTLPSGLSLGRIGLLTAAIGGIWVLVSTWRGGSRK